MIDFISSKYKISKLNHFITNKLNELKENLSEKSNNGFFDKYKTSIITSIVDNLHVEISDVKLTVRNKNSFELGFGFDQCKLINTNDKWKEIFVDRTEEKFKNITIFKLLTLEKIWLYLDTESSYLQNSNNYLINPMCISAKVISNQTYVSDNPPNIKVNIELDKFDIQLKKKQYDSIINITNLCSEYSQFQYNNIETMKYLYFKPRELLNHKPDQPKERSYYSQLFKYGIRLIVKKLKYLRGNKNEFKINPVILIYYKEQYIKYLRNILVTKKRDEIDIDVLDVKEQNELKWILSIIDTNQLFLWSIVVLEEKFKSIKEIEKSEVKSTFIGKLFNSKKEENKYLSEKEKDKINEYFQSLSKTLDEYEITENKDNHGAKAKFTYFYFDVSFTLGKGSVSILNNKIINNELSYKEGVSLEYSDLSISVNYSLVNKTITFSSYLKSFSLYIIDIINKEDIKLPITTNIKKDNDKIWNIETKYYLDKDSKINLSLNATLFSFDVYFRQALIERLIMFFLIKPKLDDKIVSKSKQKWESIKVETKNQMQELFKKQNIINIVMEERNMLFPFNRINENKGSFLIFHLGSTKVNKKEDNNTHYNTYTIALNSLSLSFYENYYEKKEAKLNIIDNTSAAFDVGILSHDDSNDKENNINPMLKCNFLIEKLKLNLSNLTYNILLKIDYLFKSIKGKQIWKHIEEDNLEIKKKSTIIGKIITRLLDGITKAKKEEFSVLYGNHIYFYNKPEDESYYKTLYINDYDVLFERESLSIFFITKGQSEGFDKIKEMRETIRLFNNLEVIQISLANEKKYDMIIKLISNKIEQIELLSMHLSNDTVNEGESKGEVKTTTNKNEKKLENNNLCELKFLINEVEFNYSSSLTSNLLFTFNLFNIHLLSKITDYSLITYFSINQLLIVDKTKNNDLLSNIFQADANEKLIQINFSIIDKNSIDYNNNDILINIQVGHLKCLWNPDFIKLLLESLVYDEVYKLKADEVFYIEPKPISNKKNSLFQSVSNIEETHQVASEVTIKVKVEFNLDSACLVLLKQSDNNYFKFVQIDLQSSSIIANIYEGRTELGIVLGNIKLYDLSNYPYYSSNNQNINSKREVVGFEESSSIKINIILLDNIENNRDLIKDNVTTIIKIEISSAYLIHFNELSILILDYLLVDLVGSLKHSNIEENNLPSNLQEDSILKNSLDIINSEKVSIELFCNNPKIILKERPSSDKYFILSLGNIQFTNNYTSEKGRCLTNPDIERLISHYMVVITNINITTNDNFIILDKSDVSVKISKLELHKKEQLLSDLSEIFNSPLEIDLMIPKIILNIKQTDIKSLLRINDLNLNFTALQKEQKEQKKESKESETLTIKKVYVKDNISLMKFNSKINNIIVNLLIDEKTPLVLLLFDAFQLNFDKKITNESQIQIILEKTQVRYNQKYILYSNLTSSNSKKQVEIVILLEETGEKQISININKTNILFISDCFMLMKEYFNNALPSYDYSSIDLPNKYDPNKDNSPEIKVYLEINESLITLDTSITDTINLSSDIKIIYKKNKLAEVYESLSSQYHKYNNQLIILNENIYKIENQLLNCFDCISNQDKYLKAYTSIAKPNQICDKCNNQLSVIKTKVDIFSLCIKCKDYIHFINLCKGCKTQNEELLLLNTQKDNIELKINSDKRIISNVNIWFYNINPYLTSISSKKKLLTGMDIHIEYAEYIKYATDLKYVANNILSLDISPSILNLSYKDLVVILKAVESSKEYLSSDKYNSLLEQ